ncbi:MAG: hypothetical protein HC888_01875 [Candidatus Competibacteraceae bacterium]|nr:hypothetical protein [Candidatus Competibacteraceae bacterium]
MDEILDGLQRVINRWVDTSTPITADITPGDMVINVASARRFRVGDEVMIETDINEGEANHIVDDILSDTQIVLSTPTEHGFIAANGVLLRKLMNGMYVQFVSTYEPEVLAQHQVPAVTINGTDDSSEWMTIDSTKERFNVDIKVFAQASNLEDANRFVRRIAKVIKDGLKHNIYLLVNDYDTTEIIADVASGDSYIKVSDSSVFESAISGTVYTDPMTLETYRLSDVRMIIEDRWKSQEVRVRKIIDANTIQILPQICEPYLITNNAIAIQPKRFIFNSWPAQVSYGKQAKSGSLYQVATIKWFCEEQEMVDFRNDDPHLK